MAKDDYLKSSDPISLNERSNVGLRRATIASDTTPAQTSSTTLSASDTPLQGFYVDKKRKFSDGAQEKHDADIENAGEGNAMARASEKPALREKGYRQLEKAYLDKKEEVLTWKSLVIDQEQTNNRLRQKAADREETYSKTISELREEIRRVNAVVLDKTSSFLQQRQTIIQKDLSINELEKEQNRLKTVIDDLYSENRHLHQQLARGPRAAQPAEPSLVPDPNPAVRDHHHYRHPNAPREHSLFKGFTSYRRYGPNEGKVRPTKYGSNSYWDLGLCKVHFTSDKVCQDAECEFRHTALTVKEKVYMKQLEPLGKSFLDDSVKLLHGKNID